jgi:hypothetical protein
MNRFIDQVGLCLKNNVSFGDNHAGKVMTITLTHNTEYIVNPALANQKNAPNILGAFPVIAQKSSASSSLVDRNVVTGFGVNLKSNGTLGIVAQFSQGAGTSASVTFIILFG